MTINEKKIVEYLENHIGENTTTYRLAVESGACEGMSDEQIDEEMMEIDNKIRNIAEKNDFRLNDDHHAFEELGMPWVIDFYIEIADVEKDIKWVTRSFQPKMRTVLVMEEYGIYDEWKDRFIGFRMSIPWQIKQIYDEACAVIEELEKDGVIID